ncbi:MAG: hypothetical protein E4H36_13805 [Spirochaetales bacterium]|nr:MAG: hypothetical protein E4H36_13805 [Spirochaetales bacterium]
MEQKTNFDIIGIGTVAVDDYLHVNHYPEPDQKERVLSRSRKLGGLVGTALASAARIGAACAFGGALGFDELSETIKNTFRNLNIDYGISIKHPEGQPTHSIIIVDDEKHTRNIFFYQQKEFSTYEEIDFGAYSNTKFIYIDQSALKVARNAHSENVQVIADMEWLDRDDIDVFMDTVDHLILPVSVARILTGKTDPKEMLFAMPQSRRRRCTAITCGEEGCYFISPETDNRVMYQRAFSIEPVETNGCGDVVHGAYASSLASGSDIPRSILFASSAAAIYASRSGGWEYLPTSAEILELCDTVNNPAETM